MNKTRLPQGSAGRTDMANRSSFFEFGVPLASTEPSDWANHSYLCQALEIDPSSQMISASSDDCGCMPEPLCVPDRETRAPFL
jgi:hypothetical protein